ncbi:hypothetical protein CMMCAS04_07935 [Clavibacter michiganensis subsp. michiganensis]|nr:hypothetical protein CMMCAS04_07935 [Clavibacter michiganensis subsp. michiganensis]
MRRVPYASSVARAASCALRAARRILTGSSRFAYASDSRTALTTS